MDVNRLFPLWNYDSDNYIPVISKFGEKKIFSQSELNWNDIGPNKSEYDELIAVKTECFSSLNKCFENALAAIKENKEKLASTCKLPILPKTPKPIKKTSKRISKANQKNTKRSSTAQTLRRSTRSTVMKNSLAISNCFLSEEVNAHRTMQLVTKTNLQNSSLNKEILSIDPSVGVAEPNISFASHSPKIPCDNLVQEQHTDLPTPKASQNEVEARPNQLEVQFDNEDKILPSQDETTKNAFYEDDQIKSNLSYSNNKILDSVSRKSFTPLPLRRSSASSRKASLQRTRASQQRKRNTRTTRQTKLEEDSTSNENTASPEQNHRKSQVLDLRTSPENSPPTIKLPGIIEEGAIEPEKEVTTDFDENRRPSVIVRRLTDEEIRNSGVGLKILNDEISEMVIAEENNNDQSFHLSVSGSSFEEEIHISNKKKVKKSNRKSVKRSSTMSTVIAKKRRLTRQTLLETLQKSSETQSTTDNSGSSTNNDLATSRDSTSRSSIKKLVKKPKPRIVKPVVKRKSKNIYSSVKKNSRQRTNPPLSSATPVRTRSKFMSPLIKTPSSSNINTTVKSFLVRNTPEQVNKSALIEAKKKQIEEKHRQKEERQRMLEEKKKLELAEAKQKREERALRAVRIREMKAREVREKQDLYKGKWEQRIADADRTKSQRKLETTAKVIKEMEKIAKADARRKEDEKERMRKLQEQEEERERRLLQQQAEKKLALEQRLRQKHLEEEQKRQEEEEKMRLAQEEAERVRKEEAFLKKKQEEEINRKKQKEKLQAIKKNAELAREAARKQKIEEKRIAREEEKRKREERRAREEKLRQVNEEAEAEKERLVQLEKKKRAEKAREHLRLKMEEEKLQLQNQLEQQKKTEEAEKQKLVEKEKAEKRKEFLRQRLEAKRLYLEKQRQIQLREKEEEELKCQRQLEEAEERLKKLVACPADKVEMLTPNTTYVKQNMDKTMDESTTNYDMTPRGTGRVLLPSTETDYNIDDFRSDDSTDDEDRPKKVVPKWAKGALLQSAIVHQYRNPPNVDKIFPNLLDSVQLTIMFKKSKPRYYQRTSSAQWNSPIMPPSHISFTEQCKGFN